MNSTPSSSFALRFRAELVAILSSVLTFLSINGSAYQDGDFRYEIWEDTAAVITGYTGAGGTVILPDSVGGWPVRGIESYAFFQISDLTNITIRGHITSLGMGAFQRCVNLESVSFDEGLMSIGPYAFEGCTNLQRLTIPNSVTVLGQRAFASCSGLKDVALGTGITAVGLAAFENCINLKSVTLPNVTSIEKAAFSGCTSLTDVELNQNLISIGDEAFYHCPQLATLTVPVSVISIDDRSWR